jgi:vesicle-fusing ATPase
LFKRPPPKGRKLLIIATATYRDILEQLGLIASFSKVIHLSNMSSGKHILRVLNEIEHCFNDEEMRYLEKKLNDKKYAVLLSISARMVDCVLLCLEYGSESSRY